MCRYYAWCKTAWSVNSYYMLTLCIPKYSTDPDPYLLFCPQSFRCILLLFGCYNGQRNMHVPQISFKYVKLGQTQISRTAPKLSTLLICGWYGKWVSISIFRYFLFLFFFFSFFLKQILPSPLCIHSFFLEDFFLG